MDKASKLVCGVGVNDANYVVQIRETIGYVNGKRKRKLIWMCPFYLTWTNMLKRGYSTKCKEKHHTYKNITVCEEWWLFSNFKCWMEQQPYEGMQLDKDILVKGNKEYNSASCVFVPSRINKVLTDSGATRGLYPLGVCYMQKQKGVVNGLRKPYVAQVATGNGSRQKYLGIFPTPQEAHKAWQLAKADVIEDTINWWKIDEGVKHTFRQDVADALLERSKQLKYDAEYNIETTVI